MSFLAGLTQGLSQGKAQGQQQQLIEDFKKTQKKLIDAQVDATITQQKAKEKFASLFELSNEPEPGTEGPPQKAQPGKSFVELLSDPEGQMSGLLSGMVTPKDIGMAQERTQFEEFLKTIQGGGKGSSVGFTPESMTLAAATRDPKLLEAVKPVQKVVQTAQGPRLKSLNPYTGAEIADLGADKEDKVPVGDAGKIQSIDFANQQLTEAMQLLAPNGQIDKTLVAALSSPIKFGAAREIDQLIGDAIATKVLVQSGVTAREDEVERTKQNFVPGLLDLSREGLAERKLDRLRQFMEGALDLTVLPPSLQKKIKAKKNKPSLNLGKKKDLSKLSNEELQAIIDGK